MMHQFVYHVSVSHANGSWINFEFHSASELSQYLETLPYNMDQVQSGGGMTTLVTINRQEVVPSDHPKLIDS